MSEWSGDIWNLEPAVVDRPIARITIDGEEQLLDQYRADELWKWSNVHHEGRNLGVTSDPVVADGTVTLTVQEFELTILPMDGLVTTGRSYPRETLTLPADTPVAVWRF